MRNLHCGVCCDFCSGTGFLYSEAAGDCLRLFFNSEGESDAF